MNANIIKAISDKTRLKILKKISETEICACKIPYSVGISQSAVSQHLKIMLDSDLVTMRTEGTKHLYSLSKKGKQVLKDIEKW
ncbi:metalloregulator ArsR/SmtB family transcription factor [Candidatus Micrarchaeota archaeon]|jgi:DNA-binding transcriptional ArsR family regulator|nr:metalloregulator ArsR/SmtB family transcription factor [Candidatus Micrarchaeota archaeon]